MMRKRNKRVSRRLSVVASGTMHLLSVILVLFVMVILNLLASSSCKQQLKAIGEKNRELGRLEDARMRETSKWEAMCTPEKVEQLLLKHGLSMRSPRADQIVRLRPDGAPYPGQQSVARLRQRTNLEVGAVRPTSRRRR